MSEELRKIEKIILEFCKKYNCSIEIETITAGRDCRGIVIPIKVCSKIIT